MGIFDFFKSNKKDKVFSHYKSGQLKEEGYWKDGKPEGLMKEYHENGQLKKEGYWKDGKQKGLWKDYDENGQLKEEGNFKEGEREGLMKGYHENGQLNREGYWKDGEQEGLWKFYHENGQLKKEGNFKDGEQEGLWKFYHENGQLNEEGNFKDGKPEGLWKFYHENGQLKVEGNIKEGEREGLWKFYHENGQLKEEGNFKDGKQKGLWKEYDENGQLNSEGNFKEGEQEGLWKYYHENGQLKDERNFKDGVNHGSNKLYYPNQQLQVQINWTNGIQDDGEVISYHDNGGKARQVILLNNKFTGNFFEWYSNGKNKKQGHYLDEKQIILKEWNENGQLEEEGNKRSRKSLDELSKEYLDELIAVPNKNRFNKETSKSSESVDLSGDQKMLNVVYPKLKGINFSKVKFGASGNSAAEFFASDIDGDWHYAQSQMIMLFKAFSKNRIESELKLLLNQNEINLDDKIEKTEFFAEHWEGDGFKIEHPVMEGIDIIIITNENMVPQNSLTLQETDLAPEVKLPTGYENVGIEHVYDGSKFLKANQGKLSLNIPLLFKDNDDSPHYILIGVTTLTLAKRIIDNIIENNYGKQYFKELDEKDGWQYTYANKFFSIGFLSKYNCVRINMLHNLVDIRAQLHENKKSATDPLIAKSASEKLEKMKFNINQLGLKNLSFYDLLGGYNEEEIDEIKEQVLSEGYYEDELLKFRKVDDSNRIECYIEIIDDDSTDQLNLMKLFKDDPLVVIVKNFSTYRNPKTGEEISYVIFNKNLSDKDDWDLHVGKIPPTLKGGEYDKKNFMSEEELAEYHELKETTQALPSDDVEEFYLTRASIYDPKEWIQKWLSEDYGHNRTD